MITQFCPLIETFSKIKLSPADCRPVETAHILRRKEGPIPLLLSQREATLHCVVCSTERRLLLGNAAKNHLL